MNSKNPTSEEEEKLEIIDCHETTQFIEHENSNKNNVTISLQRFETFDLEKQLANITE